MDVRLFIKRIHARHFQSYGISATNALGKTSRHIELVQSKPQVYFQRIRTLSLPAYPPRRLLVIVNWSVNWLACVNRIRWFVCLRWTVCNCSSRSDRRKCAEATGTVPVPWAGHFSAKILIYFSNKIYGNSVVKQRSGTVMVWNYQNADCILRKTYCHLL